MGSPPPAGTKKCVPKKRSNMSSTSATVITGKAVITRNWVTSVIQLNTGRRIIFIPGARMLRIVTMKLKPAASDAMPRIWRPSSQKSMFGPGENCFEVRFAYPNQPPSGATDSLPAPNSGPATKLAFRNSPPRRNTQ